MYEDQAGKDPNSFLSNLLDFYADSAVTCFSAAAGRACVPVGLSCASALLVLLSCLWPVCQRCKHRGGHPGESGTILYCFLGNLCGTVGAVLSKQLQIQILMGLVATGVDAVNMISCCYPVCWCWNSHAYKRQRMMRRRRRQNLLVVFVLTALAGGFLRAGVSRGQAEGPHRGRSLLHVARQDNTEILGYILGLLSFVITSTSRFSALRRAHRGPALAGAHVFSAGMCSLAGALYAAAILLCDTRIGFLLRVLPWLLSAFCTVILDLLIVLLHWNKTGRNHRTMILSSDTESLLGGSGTSRAATSIAKVQVNPPANLKFEHFAVGPFSAKPKNVQMSEMGRYMDVTVPPARRTCSREVTVSKKKVDDRFLKSIVRIRGVDVFCSSCDSSGESSDLEWDFEAGPTYLEEPKARQQEGDEFPLQPWPSSSETCSLCTYAMSGLPHAVNLAK